MDRPSSSTNPFSIVQSRYLILGTFLLASIAVGWIHGYLQNLQLLPWPKDDPIAIPVLAIAIDLVQAGVIIWASRDYRIKLSGVFGPWPPTFSLPYAVLLVCSLLLFSLGSFLVLLRLVSISFPDYAMRMLQTAGDTRYPNLYGWLILFRTLISASFAEELVFRGILLQRWGTKWGLREGLVGSSVLFGVLHFSNPVGLTVFGLVMGLLYLRTGSLWVPILCHSLNNLMVAGLNWLSPATEAATLATTQQNWGLGVVMMVVAAPLLLQFVRRSWPQVGDEIPYLSGE
ncbi:MAG: type II CAAX endopeptidase family protein [Cyanobacteria bacterium J06648_10]